MCVPCITYPSDDSDRESQDDSDHHLEAYLSEADDEAKYKREKERNESSLRKGKGLMAESHDWADEPTFDSEKEISSKRLMAKTDDVAKDTDTMMDFSTE
ncbi:hypothetical protein L6452_03701 [Arctium lappa]|uniref:Uncharacterized protein n=1 Tax=Arctium lappa TaxID=4217 RepID=A0ACB9FMZ2_ARCLA|nr:hypothetical protein L6452_03701 [Arctium lappa]